MADLFIELLSEEIPAGLQEQACDDFVALMEQSLRDRGLDVEYAETHSTPRRLILQMTGIETHTPTVSEQKKGPRINAPDKAIEGFMRSAGISSIDDAEIIKDDKKGDYYVVNIDKPGVATSEILPQCIEEVIRKFPWPKSMKCGNRDIRWIRPLHNILCIFNDVPVRFELDGIQCNNMTRGHRIMFPEWFEVKNYVDYLGKMTQKGVVFDRRWNRDFIMWEIKNLVESLGLYASDDGELLEEIIGLCECPCVMIGEFDESFLSLPHEIIEMTINTHQKCMVLRRKEDDSISNKFVIVANIVPNDKGKSIIQGNQRVVNARLADALFFWNNDLKVSIWDMAEQMNTVPYAPNLGSMLDRTERIRKIVEIISPYIIPHEDFDRVKTSMYTATYLCKADRMSQMVTELPKLQGIMGGYYALHHNELEETVIAIRDHYKPNNYDDDVPTDPITIVLALADRLETIVSMWMLDRRPTGSKDPYQVRKAAIGLIAIIMDNEEQHRFRIPLNTCFEKIIDMMQLELEKYGDNNEIKQLSYNNISKYELIDELLEFVFDRIKVSMKEDGIRYDCIDAVFSAKSSGYDDIILVKKRAEALGEFIETDDGVNLLAGLKRVYNILKPEDKKTEDRDHRANNMLNKPVDKTELTRVYGKSNNGIPRYIDVNTAVIPIVCEYGAQEIVDSSMFQNDSETKLYEVIINNTITESLEKENYESVMKQLAEIRPIIDEYFESVMINDDDKDIRNNRLNMLAKLRTLSKTVADFSKIAG